MTSKLSGNRFDPDTPRHLTGSRMNFNSLVKASLNWYRFNEAPRGYHNYYHAQSVAEAICELTPAPAAELLLAAWYHDAVYVPGAGGDANEQCSAAALKVEYLKIRNTFGDEIKEADAVIASAQDLIRKTSVEWHLHKGRVGAFCNIGMLLDADLSSLALPYEEFLVNQKNIIIENGGTFKKNQPQSAMFLRKFLECKEFIYHTDKARALWEEKARTNIMIYCSICIQAH